MAPITVPPVAGTSGRYGLSDQNGFSGEDTFQDPKAQSLRVKRVRLIVQWDTITRAQAAMSATNYHCEDYHRIYDWISRQVSNGREPLISFERARVKAKILPSLASYQSAVRGFLDQFPAVRVYTAWNEPNYANQPTQHEPERAGDYYRVLNSLCKSASRHCSVVAGDFSDVVNGANDGLTDDYLSRYYSRLRSPPSAWALHLYQTVATGKVGRFQRFLDWGPVQRAKQVWITEAGVYRYRRNGTQVAESVGAAQLKALFDSSVYKSNLAKIARFYYYEWHAGGPNTEDSGLANGLMSSTREIYCTFKAKSNPGAAC